MLKDYHHFKGKELSRYEKVQRKVTQILLESDLPDEQRESSIIWEIKHQVILISGGPHLSFNKKGASHERSYDNWY